jgi:hypothetical protein
MGTPYLGIVSGCSDNYSGYLLGAIDLVRSYARLCLLMKVSRPAAPASSGSAVKAGSVGRSSGEAFAAKLERATAKSHATSASTKTAATGATKSVSDIGAQLRAGRITPQAAIDKVIDRIVTRQLGIHAGPAAKEKIGAALRERLADDPLLAAKVRALSEE